MTKYLFFVNLEDAPLIMTKDFVDKIDDFFEKTDKMLFINTMGKTRIEALPEVEKEKKKCRNCGCDPSVGDVNKTPIANKPKASIKTIVDGKLNADTGF